MTIPPNETVIWEYSLSQNEYAPCHSVKVAQYILWVHRRHVITLFLFLHYTFIYAWPMHTSITYFI